METIRAILSLVPIKNLKIQQMDVKGTYLNGILKEKVYMRQPEGYDDGTGRVCLMIKTLYGLKQSGREWNAELDKKTQRTRIHTSTDRSMRICASEWNPFGNNHSMG